MDGLHAALHFDRGICPLSVPMGRTPRVVPELRKGPVALPRLDGPIQQRFYEFAYHSRSEQSGDNSESVGILEPIDEVNQWLLKGGYKCIASTAVKLTKGSGKIQRVMHQFGNKRYMLYCDKSCEGLRYTLRPSGYVTLWGTSEPYPVLQINTCDLRSAEADFTFIWNDFPQNVMLTLSQWSNGFGDYGGGCKATMFLGH